jgi:hemerythrin
MDRDHADIVGRFERMAACGDADLPAAFAEIEAEIRDHFAREEALFARHRVPIAHCHAERHAELLAAFDAPRRALAAGDAKTLRRFLLVDLPRAVAEHVDTVDRITSGFLVGLDDDTTLTTVV